MPMVPRRDERGVSPAPIPTERVPTDVPALAFGSPAQPDLGPLEGHVANIIQRERERADTTALLDADNQLATLQTDLHTQATSLKGKEAMGASARTAEAWQKGISEITAGLHTDQQRRAFAGRVGARWGTLYAAVESHAAGESEKYQAQTADAAIANRLSQAIEFYQSPAAVNEAIGETKAIFAKIGAQQGWSPEIIADKTSGAVTRIHAGVIDRLLANDQDRTASEYFAAHKDAIAGDTLAKVEGALEQGSLRGESQRQADSIIAKAKGSSEAREAVLAIPDAKLRDATEERVRRHFADAADAARVERDARMQQATNVIEQTRDVTRVPPGVWSQLTLPERKGLRDYALELQKGVPVATDWTTYYDLKSLATSDVTRDKFLQTNLLGFKAQLGDAEFKELTGLQAELRKGESSAENKLGSYRTAAQVVNDGLAAVGIDPTPDPKKDQKTAARVALFRRSVDEQIQALESRTKKKAGADDVQSIVDNLLVRGVRISANGNRSGDSFVFERQVGDRLVLKAKDVPPGERTRIEAALRRNKLPVSDATVLHLYLQRLGKIPTFAVPPE